MKITVEKPQDCAMGLRLSRGMKELLDTIALKHDTTTSALIRSILERAIAEGIEIE
jgi:predicted DNA-binding protein